MPRQPDLDDLDREIRDHIDAETEENIARGMAADEARAAAIRRFGNVTRVKEDVRGVWVADWFDHLRQDARDAIRHFRRSPAFSLAVVLTLALGIGLTTAIYSVVNAVLLRPLAYAHPDRMVWLATRETRSNNEMMNSIDFANWRSQVITLERMIAYDYSDSTLVDGGEASRVQIVSASDGFFAVTGARPIFGALPGPEDTTILVLAHRTFREQFHGDPSVIGRAVSVDGRQLTIGGVLPPDFAPQLPAHVFGPAVERVDPAAYRMLQLQTPREITPATQVRLYQSMAELKPGVSIEQARAEIDAIHIREQQDHPTLFGTTTAVIRPLRDKLVGPSRLALSVLMAAALFVLLITCANVANLLLSRAAARRKEIALRMSVGSGPLRVIRQLLAESLAYALIGGVGGVLLASWIVSVVVGVIGAAVPRLTETTLDRRVMAVAIGISIGTALLFGLGPAIALCFTNVQEVLKEGGRSVSASWRLLLAGRAMVAIQLALTVVLLAGAGLMFKSVWQMTRYPAGFTPDQILTMRVDFRGPQYREQPARHQLAAALLAKAKSLPEVRTAAITTGADSMTLVLKEGESIPTQSERSAKEAMLSSISADFGPLLGMRLVTGRWFQEIEPAGAILLNETLARREFPNGDALNRRIRMPWFRDERYGTVVGVVADLKYAAIDKDPFPEVFYHHADAPLFGITLTMRIDGDPAAAAPAIRKALSTIDPTQSFYDVRTMEDALSDSIAPRRFNLLLLGTFALVALVLAILGVYSVVAYAVAERTQEIGIRLALGAERARVVRMIVRQGMWSVTAGLIIGVIGAVAATRLIAGLLYGVEPHDLPTLTMATIGLAAIAFLACAVPALKAATVDPVTALRAE